MRIAYTFRNLEPTDAIKAYAEDKIGKIQKHVHAPLEVDFTASHEKHAHCVSLQVIVEGRRFTVEAESEDLYASINLAAEKLDRQIREAKDAELAKRREGTATA